MLGNFLKNLSRLFFVVETKGEVEILSFFYLKAWKKPGVGRWLGVNDVGDAMFLASRKQPYHEEVRGRSFVRGKGDWKKSYQCFGKMKATWWL